MTVSVLFLFFFLLFFVDNSFLGIFLFFLLYFIFLKGFYLFGVEFMKGDLFGNLGLDYLSFFLVLLSLWLISIIIIMFYNLLMSILLLILFVFMYMMFVTLDLIYLFIYFEASLLPVFLILLFFGASKERYLAGAYMVVYMMFGSLPSLFLILYFDERMGSLSFVYLMYDFYVIGAWFKVIVIIMFLVKIPMFMVHIWLPKAHVEAPVYGSMLLASVMLKMGGYGMLRFMDFLFFDTFIIDFFFCFCLSGSMLISYTCIFQVDLKVLVAYSSIVHMASMLAGFFSYSELGYLGGIIMMLSHGICSSGMFYLVDKIYSISGSRLLMLNSGVMSVAPSLMVLWLVFLIDNLGVPPCFGVLGELMLLGGCLGYSFLTFFMFLFVIFFMSCFVINMFVMMVGGTFMFLFSSINLVFYYGAVMHLISLNFFVFFIGGCL